MSAICGVFRRDGRPADLAQLSVMAGAAPHRGAGGESFLSGPVGMMRQSEAAPAASVDEPADWLDARAIVLHGRIDNRGDLLRSLTAAGQRVPRGESDARLVLRAYAQWGEASASRLIGDFAFAIWDTNRQRMFAARDAIGAKPFFYYLDAARFVWATELRQLLEAGVPRSPNEGLVAEYLAFEIRSRTDTLYRDVHRLPPGHWMSVDARSVRVTRYWSPDAIADLHYANDSDYVERFRELFDAAVVVRAPAGGPVAAFLSGGVDSSSVVCTAHRLGVPLETFSLVFPGTPSADERPYIADVLRRTGLPSHLHEVTPGAFDSPWCRDRSARRRDLMDLPGDTAATPLLAAMHDRGLGAALTGAGGDHGFAGSLYHYADLLKARDWRGFVRQLSADRRLPDVGWSPAQLFSCGFRLFIPPPLRRALRPLARRVSGAGRPPGHIDRRLVKRVDLEARLQPAPANADVADTRAYVARLFEDGWTALMLEMGERAGAEHQVELRHPFFDQRVVEFAVAVPERQRWRDTATKYVVRQATRDMLPESVYARTDKADGSTLVAWAVEALGGEQALDRLVIGSLGWVNRAKLRTVYRHARQLYATGDDGYCSGLFSVWMVLAIDSWYRSAFIEGQSHGRVEGHNAVRVDAARRESESGPESRHPAETAL